MEEIAFEYSAVKKISKRSHVGVAGSGDLEILIEPSDDLQARITIRTSVEGLKDVWKSIFDRFFYANNIAAVIEINDFGATPGVISLRLAQAVEVLEI